MSAAGDAAWRGYENGGNYVNTEKNLILTPVDVDLIVTKYSAERSRFIQFTDAIVDLLRILIDAEGLEYVSATGRAKEADSLREKITREGKSYSDPLTEITDLCGARVVCYDTAAAQKICDVIARNFVVDPLNSVDKKERLDPDRFGYLSVHFIVELDNRRAQLPEWRKFARMKAEIQVRTALQHAWASLDHSLRYKSKHDAPAALHRRLYRISALLELADDEFLRLKEDADNVRSSYAADVKAGKLDTIEVNADSVDAFIRTGSNHIQELSRLASLAGFALMPPPPDQKTPWTNLIRTLDAAGLHSLRSFDDALIGFAPKAPRVFGALTSRWNTETASPRLVLDPSTLLRVAVVFSLPLAKALTAMKVVKFGPSLQSVIEHELNEGQ